MIHKTVALRHKDEGVYRTEFWRTTYWLFWVIPLYVSDSGHRRSIKQ